MFDLKAILVVLFLVCLLNVRNTASMRRVNSDAILWHAWNSTGTYLEYLWANDLDKHCDMNGKWAVLVHGWTEKPDSYWVSDMIKNFLKYRGGCVIFMDYSYYSYKQNLNNYFGLVKKFHFISDILLQKLIQMEANGFKANNGFMFGFSFGAQLVLDAARRFGIQKIPEINLCDPAGPGFDLRPGRKDPKLSAKNVMCINTSTDKGTRFKDCHQNWLMGYCGIHQAARQPYPYGNHGLCPAFYNSAFEYDFLATQNHDNCNVNHNLASFPTNYTMGYRQENKDQVLGILFADTSEYFPYNVPIGAHSSLIDNTIIGTSFSLEPIGKNTQKVFVEPETPEDVSKSQNIITGMTNSDDAELIKKIL